MKQYIFIFLTLFILFNCFTFEKNINISYDIKSKRYVTNNKIDAFYDVKINGCMQKILIQSNDIANNPILLYLHGGPGSSALIFSHIYSDKLKDNFIFVNWDQRGTAFSYHEGMDRSKISEEQISNDALTLIKYLLKTFNKKKVYLIGHSFGSVIGLQFAANHPKYLYAYIGIGQVIPPKWDESVAITYKWLHETLEKNNDKEGLKRIEKDNFPYIDLVIKYGGHHRLSIDLSTIIESSPYYFKSYPELLRKGKEFSQKNVSENKAVYNIKRQFNKSLYKIDIPLYFFEGVNDHVIACPPELVVEYCKEVKAPKKEIIWFEDSAHMINVEEPVKFQDKLIKIMKENME